MTGAGLGLRVRGKGVGEPRNDAYVLATESATRAFGALLADVCRGGLVVSLNGPLGAGKTTLVRAALAVLAPGAVAKSPTFGLLHLYGDEVAHLDFYRLQGADELAVLDLDALTMPPGIVFVEWGERFAEHLPTDRLVLTLTPASQPEGREVSLSAGGPRSQRAMRDIGERLTVRGLRGVPK